MEKGYTNGDGYLNEVNEETGEILGKRRVRMVEVVEDYIDLKLPKKYKLNNGNFITLFQDALMDISLNGRLNKTEMQVLIFLVASARFGGSVNLTNSHLAKCLKIKIPNISAAVNSLVRKNIVIKKKDTPYSVDDEKGERSRQKVFEL